VWAVTEADVLIDRVEASWRTLASCLPSLDEESAARVTAAMDCLDDVAHLARLLPVDEQRPWLDQLEEVEAMGRVIDACLRNGGRTRGGE